jgi:hypothetical protein
MNSPILDGCDWAAASTVDPATCTTVRSTLGAEHRFLVRVVRPGARYGLGDCLTNQGETLVEFYDATYATDNPAASRCHGPRGQFVARYHLSTLADHPYNTGLDLYGGYENWKIDAAAFDVAYRFAATLPDGLVDDDGPSPRPTDGELLKQWRHEVADGVTLDGYHQWAADWQPIDLYPTERLRP